MARLSELRDAIDVRKAGGMSYREIAQDLGKSRSWIAHVASDKSYETTLRSSRQAKRKRTGKCLDCGAPTRYNGHGVSKRCIPCGQSVAIKAAKARVGTGPTQARILDFLSVERRFTEVAAFFGWENGPTSSRLSRMLSNGLIDRPRRGVYVRKQP